MAQAALIEALLAQGEEMKLQREEMRLQREENKRQFDQLTQRLSGQQATGSPTLAAAVPPFAPFDSTVELWKEYLQRYKTFLKANSVPGEKETTVFLTNQTSTVYQLLVTQAGQQDPPKQVDSLSLSEINVLMQSSFDPRRFVVRERYKFWSAQPRKPGETVAELAARVRQAAATCDFPAITAPLDEALRTKFLCSVGNEAVLKALFKVKADELTFARAVEVAAEVEEAAQCARDTVQPVDQASSGAFAVHQPPNSRGRGGTRGGGGRRERGGHRGRQRQQKEEGRERRGSESSGSSTTSKSTSGQGKSKRERRCKGCGLAHSYKTCFSRSVECFACAKTGHLSRCCPTNPGGGVNRIQTTTPTPPRPAHRGSVVNNARASQKGEGVQQATSRLVSFPTPPPLLVPLCVEGQTVDFEVDTGAGVNVISEKLWRQLGQPSLAYKPLRLFTATQKGMPIRGVFSSRVSSSTRPQQGADVEFVVTRVKGLQLLGRTGLQQLNYEVCLKEPGHQPPQDVPGHQPPQDVECPRPLPAVLAAAVQRAVRTESCHRVDVYVKSKDLVLELSASPGCQ